MKTKLEMEETKFRSSIFRSSYFVRLLIVCRFMENGRFI